MKRFKLVKCDKCQKQFRQNWVVPRKNWSQINEVFFWTDGKSWANYKILCRSCLTNWYENDYENFIKLVPSKKHRLFVTYRGTGLFNKPE